MKRPHFTSYTFGHTHRQMNTHYIDTTNDTHTKCSTLYAVLHAYTQIIDPRKLEVWMVSGNKIVGRHSIL